MKKIISIFILFSSINIYSMSLTPEMLFSDFLFKKFEVAVPALLCELASKDNKYSSVKQYLNDKYCEGKWEEKIQLIERKKKLELDMLIVSNFPNKNFQELEEKMKDKVQVKILFAARNDKREDVIKFIQDHL